MSVCDIPNCPVLTVGRARYCQSHGLARTAKDLGINKNELTGNGGQSCVKCRRKFRETDFVLSKRVDTTKRRKKSQGWAHVACEPKTSKLSKKAIRESVTPLFDDATPAA